MPYACIRHKYGVGSAYNWEKFGLDENYMSVIREVWMGYMRRLEEESESFFQGISFRS
jgi:hypothetical protein